MKRLIAFTIVAAFAVAPTARAASNLTFDVSVTNSSISGFTPQSFQLTVDTTNYYPVPLWVYQGNYLVTNAAGSTNLSGDPLTSGLLSILDPVNPSAGFNIQLATPSVGGYVRIGGQSTTMTQHVDGLWYYDNFSQYLTLNDGPGFIDSAPGTSMTLDHLTSILKNSSSISFSEFATISVSTDVTGFNTIPGLGQQIYYSGTATLAPVPEPQSYAMLLGGLGLLGFISRRCKRKVT